MTGLANRYIDVQAPWGLKKSDPERMATLTDLLHDRFLVLRKGKKNQFLVEIEA